MVKTTLKQLRKWFNSVYVASDFYLNVWTCWNTELQRVQVNQCQFWVFALPSFLVDCLVTCLDCFTIFAPTRHECMVFIKCFCPISLCFILSFWSGSLPDKTYRLFNFNDQHDYQWKKLIVNTCLNFYFCTVSCCPMKSSTMEQFWCVS